MKSSSETRIVLSKPLRKLLFGRVKNKKTLYQLAKEVKISRAMLYSYKNGKTDTIPDYIFQDLVRVARISTDEIKDIERISAKEVRDKGLVLGRTMRRNKLKEWKRDLPKIKDIIRNNEICLYIWFQNYQKLINFGTRKILNINETGNKIIITYTCYTKGKKKLFKSVLPRKIKIDKDFQYFFGLWCGDNVGGGRLGIVNKCEDLYFFVFNYLKKIYQTPRFVVLKSSRIDKLPEFGFSYTTTEVKNMLGNWVVCAFAINGILKSFFDYLNENLDEFLSFLPNKYIFFSGLFDAEGNVSLEDRCFRWSCKNNEEVEIYKKHLSDYNLFKRYDGASLITYNSISFLKKIFPHIRHKEKINRINLLFFGNGRLDDRFKKILICIHHSPGKTLKELANTIGRKKVYSQVKFLCNTGYSKTEGYPLRIYITEKGMNEIKEVVM